MVELFIDGLRKCALADVIEFGEQFLTEWEKAITLVAPVVKNPAFSKERECRIVKGLMPDDLQTLKFIQKGSMMSRHLPLRPPGRNPANPYRLPIAEIMVGPCRHPQISRTSLDTLLRQKGFPSSLVSISMIPFQNT